MGASKLVDLKFCPYCRGRLVARLLFDKHRLVCTQCGRIVHQNHRVAVSTIAFTTTGHMVLVRRAIEPGYGRWVIPGGYSEVGEKLDKAAMRETLEEVEIKPISDRLVLSGLYSYPSTDLILVVYAIQVERSVLTWGPECLEARWFSFRDIPWSSLVFDSTKDALHDWLAANGSCWQSGLEGRAVDTERQWPRRQAGEHPSTVQPQ